MFCPGKTNIANTLSHLNSDHVDHVEEYYFVRAVVVDSVPIAISTREIEKVSYNEEELTRVKEYVKTGNLDR